jgi:hypothetical protein
MAMKAKLFLFVLGFSLLAPSGWAATAPGSFQLAETGSEFCQENYTLCLRTCENENNTEACTDKCQVDYQNCMSH